MARRTSAPKTRLSAYSRERIRDRLIARAFDDRAVALNKERAVIAAAVFAFIVPVADQKILAQLPADFAPTTSEVVLLENNGYHLAGMNGSISWKMGYPERYPAQRHTRIRLETLPTDLRERVSGHVKAEQDWREERSEAFQQLNIQLNSFRTVEDLVVAWPQAASIIHDTLGVDGTPKKTLPALTNLNDILNLPPASPEAEELAASVNDG